MANENEDIKKNEEETNDQPKHKSWLGELLEQADTDFPLSGAETDEDLEDGEEADDEEDEDNSSFREDLDTEFPLSGGEVER